MSKDTFPPWINGIYALMSSANKVFKVEGENVKLQELKNGQESDFSEGIWKFGAFGNTQKEVENVTGKKSEGVKSIKMNSFYDSALPVYCMMYNAGVGSRPGL